MEQTRRGSWGEGTGASVPTAGQPGAGAGGPNLPPPPGQAGAQRSTVPPPLPGQAPAPKRVYERDGRDRLLLLLALGLGLLFAELVLGLFNIRVLLEPSFLPGLLVTVLVAAWYGVLFWYRGRESLLRGRSLPLFLAVCALALTFSLFSCAFLRVWNLLLLPMLMGVQFFEGTPGTAPWYRPRMLWERLGMTLKGLFGSVGAFGQTVSSLGRGRWRRWGWLLLGTGVAAVLLALVVPLLSEADALFAQVVDGLGEALALRPSAWIPRLLLALAATPFLFGLLYTLRRPEERKPAAEGTGVRVDATAPVVVLGVLDGLYLLFLGVQFAALFGGEGYLREVGLSYAQYARSGFFQLLRVTIVNLTVVLSCVQLCRREGKGWRAVKALGTVLVACSGVLLCSAVWRMSLYVGEYGLSVKRLLTYWGMGMTAVFLAGALCKLWRKDFSFFRLFLAAGIAGWLLLNYIRPERLVVAYNLSRYERGAAVQMDLGSLAYLPYGSLDLIEPYLGELKLRGPEDKALEVLYAERRSDARRARADWRTWSVEMWAAGQGETD